VAKPNQLPETGAQREEAIHQFCNGRKAPHRLFGGHTTVGELDPAVLDNSPAIRVFSDPESVADTTDLNKAHDMVNGG